MNRFPHTVQIVRRTTSATRGPYNSKQVSAAAPVTVAALLQPAGGGENLRDRNATISEWLLMLPHGTAIDASDQVVQGSTTYEITEPPQVWANGRNNHVEARLRVVRG